MSALPVETMEPNPASTSLPNDATTETKVETKEVTEDNANPITSGNDDSPKKSSALRTYENGVLKTSAHQHEGKNNSKYDPSVLPVTDDPKQIRSQV
jgi:lupus La protein